MIIFKLRTLANRAKNTLWIASSSAVRVSACADEAALSVIGVRGRTVRGHVASRVIAETRKAVAGQGSRT